MAEPITPHDVRSATAACRTLAVSDPEAWHGYVDKARADVLQAIAEAHPDAAELAKAVLETDAVTPAWYANA